MTRKSKILTDYLDEYAATQPEKTACVFLNEKLDNAYTYQELNKKSKSVAAFLQQFESRNERVLILLPQGLKFIASFLGCLYAGAIAIPAYPPSKLNLIMLIEAIIKNSNPIFIITEKENFSDIEKLNINLRNKLIIDFDEIDNFSNVKYRPYNINEDEVAFLQYSSGSTSIPKGVMVTHSNIIANLKMMKHAYKQDASSIFITWIPLFHDMGLIAGTLLPIYLGAKLYLLTPFSFIKNPFIWLKAISDYQGTISFSPDFGYKYCVELISDDKKKLLNLASWKFAVSGSEPIRKDTLENFWRKFNSCGFDYKALCPSYGLAEATVFVSASSKSPNINYASYSDFDIKNKEISFPKNSIFLENIFVGCGRAVLDEKILIINPTSLVECSAYEIGEIWISGPHVAKGYWQMDKGNKIFNAYTKSNLGPFLRTSDLGFFDKKNNLYIVGRIKDLIIIRGKKYSPIDIEETCKKSDPALLNSTVVAFSIEENNSEKLIIVIGIISLKNPIDFEKITMSLKKNIYDSHDLFPFEICFIKKRNIPKTTSGKLQRSKLRENYLLNKNINLQTNNTL